MATELISGLVLKGAADGMTALITNYAKRTLNKLPEFASAITSNLGPHITETYNRCSVIKTLLNPYTKANLLSVYATQRFHLSNRVVDHLDMVEYIKHSKENIIITGTGGSGKSMFTRYLWLSLFLDNDGRIPLYIELRKLDELPTTDILKYIYYLISSGKSKVSEVTFRKRVEHGDFVFILDGFDEISAATREAIQNHIMLLGNNFPDLKIVITSRPDENFSSWTAFNVHFIAPLQKKDVLELISKAEFDEASKRNFKKKISSGGLFEKHTSFLANPLLASMMLLTFSHNSNIPEKMHLFYEQAFDALFQRHDSHKEGGYHRDFKTELNIDQFKRLFSYFCLISYYDQKYGFSKDSILKYINNAAQIDNIKIDTTAFLDDLCKCVCMLVPEGLNIVFSHRSFQEYFAAYCLSFVTTNKFLEFVSSFSQRPTDQTISLLADMSPNNFRKLYVLPMAEKYHDELQIDGKIRSVPRFMEAVGQEFIVRSISPEEHREFLIRLEGRTELSDYVATIIRLYKSGSRTESYREKHHKMDQDAVKNLYNVMGLDNRDSLIIKGIDGGWVYESLKPGEAGKERLRGKSGKSDGKLDSIFKESHMFEYWSTRLEGMVSYLRIAKKDEQRSSDAMSEIFKL